MMHTCKLFVAAGIMGAVVLAVYHGAVMVLHSNTLPTLAAILVGGFVYLIAVIGIRAVTSEDVKGIPKIGIKLAAAIDKIHGRK